ncbi:MAG TPA: hypothetical protein VHB54_11990 [Mucilaginibacter sp.]|nr:hypothetical protein [Mucilaginibacter sp.]
MLLHLIAYWFLFQSFDYFGVCYDYHFRIDFINHHSFSGHITDDEFRKINVDELRRVLNDNVISNTIPVVSLLITLGLSLTISIRKKWYWVNAIFVFVVAFSLLVLWRLLKIKIGPWTYMRYIFRMPGYFFRGTMWYFITDGSVLLFIGLILIFWKRIVVFINGVKNSPLAAQ